MSWRRFRDLARRLPPGSQFDAFLKDRSNRSYVDPTLDGRC